MKKLLNYFLTPIILTSSLSAVSFLQQKNYSEITQQSIEKDISQYNHEVSYGFTVSKVKPIKLKEYGVTAAVPLGNVDPTKLTKIEFEKDAELSIEIGTRFVTNPSIIYKAAKTFNPFTKLDFKNLKKYQYDLDDTNEIKENIVSEVTEFDKFENIDFEVKNKVFMAAYWVYDEQEDVWGNKKIISSLIFHMFATNEFNVTFDSLKSYELNETFKFGSTVKLT